MPSPAIAQSLFSLLPSLPNPPPRLLNTAESLLAQSRQRASHLKPEEEIARAYACCEIACDRLRAQLRLPPTKKEGAPCKPVVYRKLLRFLEGVLENEGGITTPGKRKRDGEVDLQETPTRKVKSTPDVTPSRTARKKDGGFVGKVKAQSVKGKGEDKEAPDFVMPAIRRMCKRFKTPQMAPHVYTGTCVILRVADLWPPSSADAQAQLEPEVTTLLVALYLMVLTRMQRGKMTIKIFRGVSNRTVEMFDALSETQQIEDWIKRINKVGYCKGHSWWESVPEGVFDFSMKNLEGDNATDEDDFENAEDFEQEDGITFGRRKRLDLEQDDPTGVLLPGLGTMMSEAVDWLSEERTAQFQVWKRERL